MKLSEAQRQTLRHLTIAENSICQSFLTGSCWTRDGQFSIKVNANTFNALALRGYIGKKGATVISSFYEITDAGRAALEGDEHLPSKQDVAGSSPAGCTKEDGE